MKKYIILAILFATTFINGQSSNMFFWYDDTTNSSWEGVLKGDLYYTDLNGTTQYWSKTTPELSLDGTYALNETFSDGDYTSGNVWTVSSGSYAVVDSVGYSGLPKSLRCATAGIISIPCNWAYGYVAFDWKKGGDGNNHQIMFVNNVRTFSGASGYEIDLTSGEQYALRRYDNGTPTSIAYSGTSYLRNFTMYRDSIVRNINGSIAVYVKGGIFGSTYTLFSTTGGSGTNPVISNVYTASNYFTLQFSPGDQISNIQCAYGMGSLDLNGHEMVRYPYQNSTFEGADTTYFANNGTHSIDTSSTYKYAGSYAGKVISTGVGDTTTNFISLAYTQFQPIVAGKKYTVEYWANAVGKEGTATYTMNGTATTGWSANGGTITANNTISDGTTSFDSVLAYRGTGSYDSYLARDLSQNTTNSYILRFYYLIPTSNDTLLRIQLVTNFGYFFPNNASYGIVEGTWTYFETKCKFSATGSVRFYGRTFAGANSQSFDSLYIANMELIPIVQPTITAKIGSKSWTSDTLSIIPGVFEKVVYNFQATSAEVNTPIKIYCSQADTGWIDNFSITQAKDVMYSYWSKATADGINRSILSQKVGGSSGQKGFVIRKTTGNFWGMIIDDGREVFNTTISLAAVDNTIWTHNTILTDRVAQTIKHYKNGTLTKTSSSVNIGNTNNTSAFVVGGIGYAATWYWTTQIGETQITTFDDISTLDKTPAQIYQRGKNRVHMYDSYVGGTIQAWFFKDATANDASGNGNNLTGSGSPTVSTLTTSY